MFEHGITLTASRTTSRDIRPHKAPNYHRPAGTARRRPAARLAGSAGRWLTMPDPPEVPDARLHATTARRCPFHLRPHPRLPPARADGGLLPRRVRTSARPRTARRYP